jgi:hypothetical protein
MMLTMVLMIALTVVLTTSGLVFGLDFSPFGGPKPDFLLTSINDKQQLLKCVDSAAELLGIDFGMKTDPSLVNDILEKDMLLADLPVVRRLLGDDLVREKPLYPILNQIREGITEVHPALGVNLCAVLADNEAVASFSAPNFVVIRRTIHHIFLLDKIVSELANNNAFMVKVQKHVQDTVRSVSPHKSSLGHIYDLFKAAGIFGVAKSLTIDGAINDYRKFREQGFVTHEESESRKRGLTLNVFEATTAERLHGYFSNARAGGALSQWHPSEIRVVGENKTIEYVNPKGAGTMTYARLYETWNLAFITGNLEFPNLLYPKLLIPSVLLAKGPDYLYHRVLALWLSINFYLMAHLRGDAHVNIPDKGRIAAIMGTINLSYSEYLKELEK